LVTTDIGTPARHPSSVPPDRRGSAITSRRPQQEDAIMSNAIITPSAIATERPTADDRQPGPILVATDGTRESNAAVLAAAQLAAPSENVHVLAVVEPVPVTVGDYGVLLPSQDTDEMRRTMLQHRVTEQLHELVGVTHGWTIETRLGDPAATIARVARETHARIIVTGIGHHHLMDRLFGSETALHTLRIARVPLLAVPVGFTHLPRRVAIAVDFSDASVQSVRAAIQLFPGMETIYLVHVTPRYELQPDAFSAWMSTYREGLQPAFRRLRETVEFPATTRVEHITLSGRPARAILDFVRSSAIDAIVTGSRGAGFIDRLLVGSTASAIIRGATCLVLAVPAPLGRAAATTHPVARPLAEGEWAPALEVFTQRNAGRIASLEVDDPEIGAQAQQHDYPFLGAAYDHNDRRVELMLGDMEGGGRHLSRGIGDVQSVDLLLDDQGRDWVLRIAHGAGQTILTLRR
jgi:nucleotide-binding universal stress UspA family protein